MAELKVLITREEIAQRVAAMGADINRDYAGQSVVLLGVLKGAAIFLSSDAARFVNGHILYVDGGFMATV